MSLFLFSDETADILLPLAHKYQITRLKEDCEAFLVAKFDDSTMDDGRRMSYFTLAQSCQLEKLKKQALNYFAGFKSDELESILGFSNIEPSNKLDMYFCRIRMLESKSSERILMPEVSLLV